MRRALALLGPGLLLALGAACSTLSSLHGARTLEPGDSQISMGVSLQRGANPLSNAGLILPQVEVAVRLGVAEDVDVGARAYVLGLGFDARYRFYHRDRLHLALAPGVAGFWLPIGGLARQGSVEVHAPLIAEYELRPWLTLAGGPRVVLRDQFNGIDDPELGKGMASRLDAFTGGGLRLAAHARRISFGLSGDVLGQPARRGGLAWSTGVDLTLRGARSRQAPSPPPDGNTTSPSGVD